MPDLNPPPGMSRRKFLRVAGITAGAAALTCCGVTYAAVQVQPKTPPVAVETPSYTFGEETGMTQPILVTYATRTGSTTGVAEAIAETLAARGFRVDVRPVKDSPSLTGYQAVIIGSAVNGYRWLPEAVEYVTANQQELNHLPVALFCVHGLNLSDKDSSQKARYSYLNAVRPLVNPVAEAFFAGMCARAEDTANLVRWFLKTILDSGEGDRRDWNKIRAWAQAVEL